MNLYFDLDLRYFVQTPGLDAKLEGLTFKSGDTEEIVIQYGRRDTSDGPSTIVSQPSWTSELLSAGNVQTIGIKKEGYYSDGDLLASATSPTEDATAKTYTFSLDLNTTEIDDELQRGDSDNNDVPSVAGQFELTFKASAGAPYRSSVEDVAATIKHDILYGSEGTPTSASDPTDYPTFDDVIRFYPSVNSQTGGTSSDFDSIATINTDVGVGGAFFDDDDSGVLRVYELVSGTDAENAPDVIRPDDYAASTNEKVWMLRLDVSGGGGGLSNIVDDSTPQLGGDLDTNGNAVFLSKGTDVASANALTPTFDGNYFLVTGTTTISTIADSSYVGTVINLEFAGSLTINHSSSLILPNNGNNITTADGDVGTFIQTGTGPVVWTCVHYQKADGTSLVGNDVADDTSPSLGGALDTASNIVHLSKGSDIASGTTLTLGTDGNYFDVTGTSTISGIATTGKVGTVVRLHFDSTPTLNYNASSFILPGAANITAAAGDEAEFVEFSSGSWRCTQYTRADGTAISATVSSSADAVILSVNQTAHGLTLGDPAIKHSTGSWVAPSGITADLGATYGGIVSAVTDADNFDLTIKGEVTGLTITGSESDGDRVYADSSGNLSVSSVNMHRIGICTGTGSVLVDYANAAIGHVVCFHDEKSSGTAGGTFTSGSWQTRDLNTESSNTDLFGLASLPGSNQFRLPVGVWSIEWSAPGFKVGAHMSRLYDVNGAVAVEYGQESNSSSGDSVQTSSDGATVVEIDSGTNDYRIEHRGTSTQSTNGFGVLSSFSVNNIYTRVKATYLGPPTNP